MDRLLFDIYKLISAAPPPTLSLYNRGNRYADGHPRSVGGASQAGQKRKEGEANVKGPKKIDRCFYR